MSEQRKHQRHKCKISVKFESYSGNPDEIDRENDTPSKGKGVILDLSRSGVFVVSNSRVSVDMPIRLHFKLAGKKSEIWGTIVRTGLLQNNPSEVAQRMKNVKVKEDAYIAINFDSLIDEINI